MEAYSMDLRLRVMADVDDRNAASRHVAEKYRVSPDWIRKLKRFRRRDGQLRRRERNACRTRPSSMASYPA